MVLSDSKRTKYGGDLAGGKKNRETPEKALAEPNVSP